MMVVDHGLRSERKEMSFLWIEIISHTFCKFANAFSSSVVDDVGYKT